MGTPDNVWNLFKVNNRSADVDSHWSLSGVFIVNFESVSQVVLVFMLLTGIPCLALAMSNEQETKFITSDF